jgi:hypothetical protein
MTGRSNRIARTAQQLAVNFNNTAPTGGNLNVDFRVD